MGLPGTKRCGWGWRGGGGNLAAVRSHPMGAGGDDGAGAFPEEPGVGMGAEGGSPGWMEGENPKLLLLGRSQSGGGTRRGCGVSPASATLRTQLDAARSTLTWGQLGGQTPKFLTRIRRDPGIPEQGRARGEPLAGGHQRSPNPAGGTCRNPNKGLRPAGDGETPPGPFPTTLPSPRRSHSPPKASQVGAAPARTPPAPPLRCTHGVTDDNGDLPVSR